MHDWLRAFRGANVTFPASEIAIKVVLSLALGLLVGFEREWSNKDIGARTFAMTRSLAFLEPCLDPLSCCSPELPFSSSLSSPIFAICRLNTNWKQPLQLRS